MSFLSKRFPTDLATVRSLSPLCTRGTVIFPDCLQKNIKRVYIHVQIHFMLISVNESRSEILDKLSE